MVSFHLCSVCAGIFAMLATSPETLHAGDRARAPQQGRVPRMLDATADLLALGGAPSKVPDEVGLIEMHRAVVRKLLTLAQTRDDTVDAQLTKMVAINVLGAWKDPQASRVLLRKVEFSPFFVGVRGPLRCYPAAESLVEIGSPAAKAIVEERMRQPVNDQELRIFAWIIYLIDGKELGAARLDLALSKARDTHATSAQENLLRLIRVYRAIDFNDRTQWPQPPRNSPNKPKPVAK